jgi:hypothetical protein
MAEGIRLMAAATLAALWTLPATAVVQPLQGRTITGAAVASTDPAAVMEYDPNLNITWLRDWNYAGTQMTWAGAVTWASTLTVGAFSGWALPTIDAADANCMDSFSPGGGFPDQHYGYNCTGSPMGYLWYLELNNTAGALQTNFGPFQNMQPSFYWSGTDYAPNTADAWVFGANGGGQYENPKFIVVYYAVAARAGDVAAPVAEPETWALMAAGLSVLSMDLRRRPSAHKAKRPSPLRELSR